MSKAVTAISDTFTSRSSEKPSIYDDNDSLKSPALPVLALCSPDINSLVAVDAAIRHIAHCLAADVVILDPTDLAAGKQGVFGEGRLCVTFSTRCTEFNIFRSHPGLLGVVPLSSEQTRALADTPFCDAPSS
jgi:hypothetical protein